MSDTLSGPSSFGLNALALRKLPHLRREARRGRRRVLGAFEHVQVRLQAARRHRKIHGDAAGCWARLNRRFRRAEPQVGCAAEHVRPRLARWQAGLHAWGAGLGR